MPISPGIVLDDIGEIYGGTLDILTGTLTVDRKGYVFDGTESWAQYWTAPNRAFRLVKRNVQVKTVSSRASSHFANVSVKSSTTNVGYYAYNGSTSAVYVQFRPDLTEIPDLASWKAWLAEQYNNEKPLICWHTIATPEVYQLTIRQLYNACIQSGYPYLDYLDMITDRTQEDVNALIALLKSGKNPASDHKGSYNASDLNRVGQAVLFLVDRLDGIGINLDVESKTDWAETDIPTESQMQKYLDAIWSIWVAVMAYRPDIELPKEMRLLDYIGANQIEELLKKTELAVTRIELSYRQYSGRQISGVNCLP